MPPRNNQPGALDQRLRPAAPGALDAALGNEDPMETVGSLGANLEKRTELQGQETPSSFDLLGSPEGLLKLGLSAAALLSGNPNAQALGAGLGLGTLTGAPAEAEDLLAKHEKRVQDLNNTILQQQDQIAQLLRTQPNLFVDEQGEDMVEPERWRELLGLSVPLSPAAMYQRYRMDRLMELQLDQHADFLDRHIAAGNKAGALASATAINDLLDLKMTPEQMNGMIEEEDYMSAMLAVVHNVDPMSWVRTMKNVEINGGSPFSAKNCVLTEKSVNPDSLTGDVDGLAAQGFAIVAEEWGKLSTQERLEWGQRGVDAYIEGLLTSDERSNPAILHAVKSSLTSMRQNDRIEEIKMDHIYEAISEFDSLAALNAAFEADPKEKARLLEEAIANLAAQANAVSALGNASRHAINVSAMPAEQKQRLLESLEELEEAGANVSAAAQDAAPEPARTQLAPPGEPQVGPPTPTRTNRARPAQPDEGTVGPPTPGAVGATERRDRAEQALAEAQQEQQEAEVLSALPIFRLLQMRDRLTYEAARGGVRFADEAARGIAAGASALGRAIVPPQ